MDKYSILPLAAILLVFFLFVGVLIASTKMDKRFKKKRPSVKKDNKFRIDYFRKWFWPPKHHNITTTIIRVLVFLLGIFIFYLIALLSREIIPTYGDFVRDELRKNAPYTLKKVGKLANDVAWKHGLFESIRFAVICWPGVAFIMHIIRKIKVGQHHSERNKKIKRMIKRHSKNADYIDELERLSSLKEKGIITEEEFQAKKKELL